MHCRTFARPNEGYSHRVPKGLDTPCTTATPSRSLGLVLLPLNGGDKNLFHALCQFCNLPLLIAAQRNHRNFAHCISQKPTDLFEHHECPLSLPLSRIARGGLWFKQATVTAFAAMGFPYDDEPTVNSQEELAVATSGSHNLRRRSNG